MMPRHLAVRVTLVCGRCMQEPFERWAELPSRYGAKCLGM